MLELSAKITEILPSANAHLDSKATRMCLAGDSLDQESISLTFYECILRQKLQNCVLGLKFFGAKLLAKKAHLKC